jgi:hypothetical protein
MKCGAIYTSLMLAVVMSGCFGTGKPPTYQVTGTVTMKGKPLEDATVVFVPPEGASYQAATGVTDASGNFKLSTFTSDDGAQPGDYLIKVSKYDRRKATKEEQDKYISYEEEQKMQFGDEKPTPPSKNLLSQKYNNETTSGFTFTVGKGPNIVELKLE